MAEPQRPLGKISKRYYSWEQIHATVLKSIDQLQSSFNPTLLVGISGGGLIPSRMLRSGFKMKTGRTLPIQVVGALHYDDDAGKVYDKVERTQWLSPDISLSGQRLLLIDEVDDSRKTLAFLVAEMLKYFDEARQAHEASGRSEPWVPPVLGTYVIHNKLRPKEAEITDPQVAAHYYVGETTPNLWHVYPWDSPEIIAHTAIAQAQEHYYREKPGELALSMAASSGVPVEQVVSALTHYADGGSTAAPDMSTLLASQPSGGEGRPKSALTSALSNAPENSNGSKLGSNVYQGQLDGMYVNYSGIPEGLAPRFGSLTLVDDKHSLSAQAAASKQ